MSAVWDPGPVSEEVALTRSLRERSRDLVALAEGNTSQRLPDGRMVVKGARVRVAAYSVGGVVPLDAAKVEEFSAREAVVERRARLGGSPA
ncbi:hypothetical protein ACI79C_24870 [Geodermatophilus sp. SYSU D00697]